MRAGAPSTWVSTIWGIWASSGRRIRAEERARIPADLVTLGDRTIETLDRPAL